MADDIELQVSGDSTFVLGLDGYTEPTNLTPGEYSDAMNVINRGGVVQTRPGSVSLNFDVDLPSGNFQGLTYFRPVSGVSNLVFAVEGKVYFSSFPFKTYKQLPNIQFYHASRFIAWSVCIQSTEYTAAGELEYLDTPRSVLVMQDGVTRAAFWDGTTSRHLNPTQSPGDITLPGYDETPVGLWMKWSNNRLWLSVKDKILASDIGNPLKFTETQYLAEARAFYLPGDCTGIEETSDLQGVVCFTSEVGVLLQSSIQDRSQWLSTPKFQITIIPSVGCVSPRSIVKQYGLLWWMSPKGLMNQNDAEKLYITSRLDVQDNEMFQSKRNLSYDLSGVCGCYVENFLFHAVPNGDKLNTRIHVLDQAPFEENTASWPSYWTGWRPVEFARGTISSQERVWCASKDYDGQNRIWELFRPERTDNGIPITSFVVSRAHFFDNRDFKDFRYVETELTGIQGPTAVMVAVAGLRGAFQAILTKDLAATNGQIYAAQTYGFESHAIIGSKDQTRIVTSTDGNQTSECNNNCVESERIGLTDKAFIVLMAWSGIAGVSCYRIYAQGALQGHIGTCENDETGENRLLTPDGCGVNEVFSTKQSFTTYYSTQTYSKDAVSHTSTQSSVISQVDADRKAMKMSEWYVLRELGEII